MTSGSVRNADSEIMGNLAKTRRALGRSVQGLQLGAVDYVSKPFQAEEVIARLNTHLTIHRLSREVQEQRDQLEHELKVVSELQRELLPESARPTG